VTEQRLEEIYHAVVKDGFYTVGKDPFLTSDITHVEMQELVGLACAGKPFVRAEG
jgi:hypothetical protein